MPDSVFLSATEPSRRSVGGEVSIAEPDFLSKFTRASPTLAFLLEWRAVLELAHYAVKGRSLVSRCPRGDGRPVLVIPGFLANDLSTIPLRRFLGVLGYAPYGWGSGHNLGPRPGTALRLARRVRLLRSRHGKPVSLIGWSLGGVFARQVARYRPNDVDRVITLGSPLRGAPRHTAPWPFSRLANRRFVRWLDNVGRIASAKPLKVPTCAIYSRGDGIVNWECCTIEDNGADCCNLEVRSSHCGLGHNLEVLQAIAERLAGDVS